MLLNNSKQNIDMKKLYIKPVTEVITHDYLCQPDGQVPAQSKEGTEDFGARETEQFIEDDTNGKGFGYRRYNLWED